MKNKQPEDTESGKFIDQYEVDYLSRLKKEAKPISSKRSKKWYGKAWDIFRAIENHK